MKINYEEIIQDYNDQAFHDCLNQLYPFLHFRYIKADDVRKIDMIEKCMDHQWMYRHVFNSSLKIPKELVNNEYGIYAWEIEFFADNYFDYGEDLKPYYVKAKRIINDLKTGKTDITLLEDLVKIFVCFMRCQWYKWKNGTGADNQFEFEIEDSDSEMLKDFLNHRFEIPNHNLIKLQNPLSKPNYQSPRLMENVYFITVLIVCRLKQFEGFYVEEGDLNG